METHSLSKSFQAFNKVASAFTSGLVNLVFFWHTVLKWASIIGKPMVITVPVVPSAQLLGMGSKLLS